MTPVEFEAGKNRGFAALLQAVTAALLEPLSLDQVADVILGHAIPALGANDGGFSLVTTDGAALELYLRGYPTEVLDAYRRIPIDASVPATRVIRRGEAAWIETYQQYLEQFPESASLQKQTRTHAFALVPMFLSGRPIGALGVSFTHPRAFSEDERALITTLAHQCAIAVGRVRLFDDAQAARKDAEAARDRLTVLARAGTVLAEAHDVAGVLARSVRVAFPAFASRCAIDLIDGDGRPHRAIAAHVDDRDDVAQGYAAESQPEYARPDDPVAPVLQTGESRLVETLAGRPDAMIIVALIARGRVIGALSFGAPPGVQYSVADLETAEQLGRQVAAALENARLYASEHERADTLQRSLAPREFPSLPGVELAARYVAAETGYVGGDWYDILPLPSGLLGIVIGDVAGHGVRAAAVMGQLRTALRAYALEGYSPAAVGKRLNQLIDPQELATVFFMVLDLRTGTARYLNAGHCPPLLVPAEGQPTFVDGGSPPVGSPSFDYEDHVLQISRGDSVILYTDGLVESSRNLVQGLARLRDSAIATSPEALADRLLRTVLLEEPRDDVALLVLRLPIVDPRHFSARLPAEPWVPPFLRPVLRHWLNQAPTSTEEEFALLVSTGEACSNCIQHAYATGRGEMLVDVVRDDRELHVAVADWGRWHPPSERRSGKGLTIMHALMDQVTIEHTGQGTEVRMTLRRARPAGEP